MAGKPGILSGKRYHWPLAKMVRWYQQGRTCDEIAKTIGIVRSKSHPPINPSARLVGKVLRRNGCQMRKTGAPGRRNKGWKGGVRRDKDGYVLVHAPNHPYRTKQNCVRKHRLVMEKKLGRYLTRQEVVHHKDDNKDNNRVSNLALYSSNASHLADTLKGRCPKWSAKGQQKIRQATRNYWEKFQRARRKHPKLTAAAIRAKLKLDARR